MTQLADETMDMDEYNRLFTTIHDDFGEFGKMMDEPIIQLALTQYNLRQGLRIFGEKGEHAVLKSKKFVIFHCSD